MQLHCQKPPQRRKPHHIVMQRFVSSSCEDFEGGKASNVHVLTSCRHADSGVGIPATCPLNMEKVSLVPPWRLET
jgi:hypothetical protein